MFDKRNKTLENFFAGFFQKFIDHKNFKNNFQKFGQFEHRNYNSKRHTYKRRSEKKLHSKIQKEKNRTNS